MSDPNKPLPAGRETGGAPLPQKDGKAPTSGAAARHEERLLDEALEETFPASDPIAGHPETEGLNEAETQEDEIVRYEESLLDEALELTFPASDPIAVSHVETAARIVREQRHSAQP